MAFTGVVWLSPPPRQEQTVRQLRDQIKGLAAESAKVKHGIELLRKKKKQVKHSLTRHRCAAR